MLTRQIGRRLLPGIAAASLLLGPLPATATETICTVLIRGPDGSIPVDERESERQVQARIMPGLIAEGDKLASEGKLDAAVEAYAGVFRGHWYAGFYSGAKRCLSMDFYQKATDKLRDAASEIAEQRRIKGYLLNAPDTKDGKSQAGALGLYLISNQYDTFVDHALEYAASELFDRDIDGELAHLADRRLEQLEQAQNAGTSPGYRGLENDLTPLLAEELVAFDKLANFDEKLRAHLAPLYPNITDHWLAQEASNYDEAIKTDGMMLEELRFGPATDALERGLNRLNAHPEEVARLRARASARGNALMKVERFQPAETYFEIAGNEELAARAGRLAETQKNAWAEKFKASVQTNIQNIENMKKSDKDQAAFQNETDEMAAEFGFDVED